MGRRGDATRGAGSERSWRRRLAGCVFEPTVPVAPPAPVAPCDHHMRSRWRRPRPLSASASSAEVMPLEKGQVRDKTTPKTVKLRTRRSRSTAGQPDGGWTGCTPRRDPTCIQSDTSRRSRMIPCFSRLKLVWRGGCVRPRPDSCIAFSKRERRRRRHVGRSASRPAFTVAERLPRAPGRPRQTAQADDRQAVRTPGSFVARVPPPRPVRVPPRAAVTSTSLAAPSMT